jgi:hypothetical protein
MAFGNVLGGSAQSPLNAEALANEQTKRDIITEGHHHRGQEKGGGGERERERVNRGTLEAEHWHTGQ